VLPVIFLLNLIKVCVLVSKRVKHAKMKCFDNPEENTIKGAVNGAVGRETDR
jgi:hypothetical protein